MAETGKIVDDWVPEAQFAEANGLSVRSVARLRSAPDGLPYTRFGGRIMIHVPSARDWLMKRMVRPNPTRSGRAAR